MKTLVCLSLLVLAVSGCGSSKNQAARPPTLSSAQVSKLVETRTAVLGYCNAANAVDQTDATDFNASMREIKRASRQYGVVLDVDAWAARDRSESPTTPITPWLQAIGWRATEIGPTTQLASAWQELGR